MRYRNIIFIWEESNFQYIRAEKIAHQNGIIKKHELIVNLDKFFID